MLEQLIHNGVVVPEPPPAVGLTLNIRGEPVTLTPKQEEMAMAWAKKHGTPYVQDRTFVRNFMTDFCQELGLDTVLSVTEVDFEPAIRIVLAEREARDRMTKEARKALAAERKARREALRETYGHAVVNGQRTELANYVVEPSGIFMGRGRHPLRGRWKQGARHSDITINLSPDAPPPPDAWGEIVWEPETLWVARWRDKLSGRLKYVWLSDTAPMKQEREALKFDQAHELHDNLDMVRQRIRAGLAHPDPKQRMLATACYLIDALCLRVGDEKDEDEADTVGATTLRPEHVTLHPDGSAEFRFLGKDSVLWHKRIELPEVVHGNVYDLMQSALSSNAGEDDGNSLPTRDKPQLFPDISRGDVTAYLSDILPGLTAKVFRTHHATMAVKESLAESEVVADDPEHVKWEAASLANLEAAILCNHTKMAPANWSRSRERYKERKAKAGERVAVYRERLKQQRQALVDVRKEAREKRKAASHATKDRVKARYEKRVAVAQRRITRTEAMLEKAVVRRDKIRAQASISGKKRTWNLGTSLKSYIDPRVYHQWAQTVDYDVLEKYYPAALRRKFAWVKQGAPGEVEDQVENGSGNASGAETPSSEP